MTKSTSPRKNKRSHVNSRLTEPEFDAVLQLIQLSSDSTDSKVGNNGAFHDNNFEKEGAEEEESVGNTTGSTAEHEISSAVKNNGIIDDNLDDEACPPRQRKFRSIHDIYMQTKPLIKKQGKKDRKI
ncbi:hypothetical protein ACH5RR_001949 [Cinchona calisaya]|uniref:Uncharacterized protein n=1 Tax=Cinchona calisaya TaxID=153742 RepID=A0ABD3B4Y7_9GENT